MSEYTFGDTAPAAGRLELLATVFAPTSGRFLGECGPHAPGLAIDLGCGPGHTTELMRTVLAPERTIGVEYSPTFAAQAHARLGDHARIIEADVRALPEEVDGADAIFARLLLTHLSDPLAAVAHWRTRLSATGSLLLEEVESITTDDPVFEEYLSRQRTMLRRHGHTLEIGARLDASLPAAVSRIAELVPSPRRVAAMFALNYPGWCDEPDPALAAGLVERADGSVTADPIVWRMRQLVLYRKSLPVST